MAVTKNVAVVTDTAKVYACSLIGFLHAGAMISSLIAFICNESAPWCRGSSYCVPPFYKSTYNYFSAMTLASFLISGVFYTLHCTAMYDKLPCRSVRKLYVELVCLSGIVFFLIFGNLFMISRTGNRVLYMVSTFFGCQAMAIFGAQLVLVFLRNYSLLIVEGSIDDGAESDLECPAEEFSVQVTGMKSLNIADHSPRDVSSKSKSKEIHPYIAENESTDSPSSSDEENVPS